MDAIVTRQTIVDAVMKTTPYAKQVTLGTFGLAEPDTGPEIYHGVIECSTEFFHACVLGLETPCI